MATLASLDGQPREAAQQMAMARLFLVPVPAVAASTV
jgi:hypothetical protein